jgi:hypothetical protein
MIMSFGKRPIMHSGKKKSSTENLSIIETFDNWLDLQEKAWAPKAASKKPTDVWGMPKRTMEEWLCKQKAFEKRRADVTPPMPSTETWIRQQISERITQEEWGVDTIP